MNPPGTPYSVRQPAQVQSGSVVVNPTETTTYRLTAGNLDRSAIYVTPPFGADFFFPQTKSVTISVVRGALAAPTVSSFTADLTSIPMGGSTTLRWTLVGATSASIDNGIGPVVPSSGYLIVRPGQTTTYRLTAANSGGLVDATIRISVSGTIGGNGSSCGANFSNPANGTAFLQQVGSWQSRLDSNYMSFTLDRSTAFVLRFASDYRASAVVFRPDQWSAFKSGQAYSYINGFDNKIGTEYFTLGPGTYYLAYRNNSDEVNSFDVELDYRQYIGGLNADRYFVDSVLVEANGGGFYHPFTVEPCVRYLLDGGNSGDLTIDIIPEGEFDHWSTNAAFTYYTAYHSDGDKSQPGFTEIKLTPGSYYLVARNKARASKALTWAMERWR